MRYNPKTKSRRTWLLLIGIPVAAFLVAGKTMNTDPPTNSAQTTPDEAPELRTRVYSQSLGEVNQAARAVALKQKTWFRSWRIARRSEAKTGTPHEDFAVEVPVLFFIDDLSVHIATNEGKTRVNVKSNSRVGQGDFGENRRHVAQFLKALDEKLSDK